jgi:hypothetical protein
VQDSFRGFFSPLRRIQGTLGSKRWSAGIQSSIAAGRRSPFNLAGRPSLG